VEIQEDDVVASVAPEVGAMMRHRYLADPRIKQQVREVREVLLKE